MEDKVKSFLVDWMVDFLKNKDMILKKMESIEKNKEGFDIYVKYNDKEQFFMVMPVLENADELLGRLDENRHFGLVVLNTMENFNFLVKNWNGFARFKSLCIYFVNPFSKLDKKWVIYPYTHNNYCERNSLERGLKAMFDMVEPLTESSIKDRFK